MNLSREPLPPVNNALLPDIYNKLDAGTIEKTRVANTVLDIRLNVEQKLIAKYRREAQRMLQSQKVSAVADLSRIAQKLPSELGEPLLDSFRTGKRLSQRGYMTEKNEEIICHRCYIHHLPTKKRFYLAEPKASSQKMFGAFDNQLSLSKKIESSPEFNKTTSPTQPNDKGESRSTTETKIDNRSGKVIAPIEKYRFLDRDLCGRDRDLNDTLTPRLVAYEDWKQVVKNVCSQCRVEVKNISSRGLPFRRTHVSRERTEERFRGRKIESREFLKSRRGSSKSTTARESPGFYQADSYHRASKPKNHQQLHCSSDHQTVEKSGQSDFQIRSRRNSRSKSHLHKENSNLSDQHRQWTPSKGRRGRGEVLSPLTK
ncbi:hypothetical protein RRG08_028097 [Elysia crispata]|uniref:Uncharacterized protein n=1 Tax=Elysia crispata TaxID=231223 RepID=A0AAE1A3N7_9GAST|nr:hypothetical protein RRG08_028097 [Elysia crispata]